MLKTQRLISSPIRGSKFPILIQSNAERPFMFLKKDLSSSAIVSTRAVIVKYSHGGSLWRRVSKWLCLVPLSEIVQSNICISYKFPCIAYVHDLYLSSWNIPLVSSRVHFICIKWLDFNTTKIYEEILLYLRDSYNLVSEVQVFNRK